MPVDKIRYFPPLGWSITQKGGGEYFEDYPTFVYKADVGGFQEKKSVYIATWVKTAFVTQWGIMERRDKRGQEGTRGKVEGVEVTVCTAHPRHQHTGAAQSQNPASIILIII